MSEVRLSKVLKELGITLKTASDFLESADIDAGTLNRNSKISQDIYGLLSQKYGVDEKGVDEKGTDLGVVLTGEESSISEASSNLNPSSESPVVPPPPDPVQRVAIPKVVLSKVTKIDLNPAPPVVALREEGKEDQDQALKKDVSDKGKVGIEPMVSDDPDPPLKQKDDNTSSVDKKKSKGSELLKAQRKIHFKPVFSSGKGVRAVASKTYTTPPKSPLASDQSETESKASTVARSVIEGGEEHSEKSYAGKFQKLKGVSRTGRTVDLSQFEQKKPTPSDNVPSDRNRLSVASGGSGKTTSQTPAKSISLASKKRKRIKVGNDNRVVGGNDTRRDPGKKLVGTSGSRRGGGSGRGDGRSFGQGTVTDRQITARASRHRKHKRKDVKRKEDIKRDLENAEQKIIKVTEFTTVSELATLMVVSVGEVMETCMTLGLAPSINQSLDKDTLSLICEEYGFTLEIISSEAEFEIKEEDDEADLEWRPPVVTVMGHVDHGKTSLLDYLRKSNVAVGEAGGITQHIGAYSVEVSTDKQITFLDTPGHEAFTEMRSRGVKMTDIAIIVISAEDSVKPRTEEAIAHAQAADIPMIFAVNKIDKPNADPMRVRQSLAERDILVDEFGGKYASQDISAKTGQGIQDLLEKVILEAEVMDLKANPSAKASGTVVESFMQKGRGYMSTFLVHRGTLKKGDVVVAGKYYGKVKSMIGDAAGSVLKSAGPSFPVTVLGLNGSPSGGDRFRVYAGEKEAKQVATKYGRYSSEQAIRIKDKLFRSEVDRVFREGASEIRNINVLLRADVDGSLSTISELLVGLSSDQVKVNILFRGVGQITESDVSLATASEALVIGFGVKPIPAAKKLADSNKVEIYLYTVIYRLSEEMEKIISGMTSVVKEEVIGKADITNIYRKGTIGGCVVREGELLLSHKVRLIREDDVVYTGELSSLKRFESDVSGVAEGLECGVSLNNDFKVRVGDVMECYKIV